MTFRYSGVSVTWLGYATARVAARDGPVVYTDPGRYGLFQGEWGERYGGVPHPDPEPYAPHDGDLVVVTHDHHYDSEGIRRVAADDATVLVYEAVDAGNIDRDVEPVEELPYDVQRVSYGDDPFVSRVAVEVVPGYNEPDGPAADEDGSVIHPEGFGCGYQFVVAGTSVFWPGDSDALPAHEELDPGIFLPPISGPPFTMDRHDAAELAAALDPGIVCPIHYNTFPELRADSKAFAGDVASRTVPVVLDEGDE